MKQKDSVIVYKLADLTMKTLQVMMGTIFTSQVVYLRFMKKDQDMIFVKYMYKANFMKVSLKKHGQPSEHNPLHEKYSGPLLTERCPGFSPAHSSSEL
jgi:hypothetical protein